MPSARLYTGNWLMFGRPRIDSIGNAVENTLNQGWAKPLLGVGGAVQSLGALPDYTDPGAGSGGDLPDMTGDWWSGGSSDPLGSIGGDLSSAGLPDLTSGSGLPDFTSNEIPGISTDYGSGVLAPTDLGGSFGLGDVPLADSGGWFPGLPSVGDVFSAVPDGSFGGISNDPFGTGPSTVSSSNASILDSVLGAGKTVTGILGNFGIDLGLGNIFGGSSPSASQGGSTGKAGSGSSTPTGASNSSAAGIGLAALAVVALMAMKK